jgi:Ca-activated chloride channel homolog
MTFASPELLVGLLLVPVAIAVYLLVQRRRSRFAVRFTNVDLLANIAPKTPAWRRHVPPLLYLVAISALVVGLARPSMVLAVPREEATIILTIDVSRSMRATDVEPTRLDAARSAAEAFLERIPDELRVGAVAFSATAHSVVPLSNDRQQLQLHLDSLNADGSTATGDGLAQALELVRQEKAGRAGGEERRRAPAAVVLLSDGKRTTGRDPVEVAREARAAGVPIHTVSLGTEGAVIEGSTGAPLPVPPDPETMARIASTSGGKTFDVAESRELDSIYEDLGSQLATRPEKREITAGFAAGGLVLLVAAAALSLRTAGRLP